ncbi:MAG: TetR/AcrR family transcriptional regulator [Bacteroidaceae bacterium]|nr:TetR/AcrR family transcriptional regulator [Bacteroidaceae bacterium]
MTAQDKKNKEQLILEVAEREFFTKGFDGARTMTIAQEAGVTHAMLHYYFRTKEQLFERIISDKFELISQMVLSVLGNAQLPLVERLKEGISSHFDLVAANPLLPRFLITEMLPHPERYRYIYEKLDDIRRLYVDLQKSIDEAAERGEIERVDVMMLFTSILSLNVFPIISAQFILQMIGEKGELDEAKFLAARKQETIEMMIKRITKY